MNELVAGDIASLKEIGHEWQKVLCDEFVTEALNVSKMSLVRTGSSFETVTITSANP